MGQVTEKGRGLSGKVAVLKIRCQLLNVGLRAKVTACIGGHGVQVQVGGEPLGEPHWGAGQTGLSFRSYPGSPACDRLLSAQGRVLPSVFECYLVPRPLSSSWRLGTQTFVQIPRFLFPSFLPEFLHSCFC